MKEIIFHVEEDHEGGYIAEAQGFGIVTEADTMDELEKMVRDAVRTYFEDDESKLPKTIALRFLRERQLAL